MSKTKFHVLRNTRSLICKYIAYTMILLISFIFIYTTQAEEKKVGYVIEVDNGRIYLDLGRKHGIEEGTLFRVYRQREDTKVNIAIIKVTQVFLEASVATLSASAQGGILSEENEVEIMVADRVEIIEEIEDKSPVLKYKGNKARWLFLGAGIAMLGGASYFNQSADKAYSEYKKANSLDDAVSYRKETQLNDKRTKIAVGVSLALISISAYLSKEEDTVKKHNSSISFLSSSLEPYVNYNEIRVMVRF